MRSSLCASGRSNRILVDVCFSLYSFSGFELVFLAMVYDALVFLGGMIIPFSLCSSLFNPRCKSFPFADFFFRLFFLLSFSVVRYLREANCICFDFLGYVGTIDMQR
jgi:hypothetical protein